MASNRAVTLDGANEMFKYVGITIERDDELGNYVSTGRVNARAKTLGKLCQSLTIRLLELPSERVNVS
jgi:hypothetical protein